MPVEYQFLMILVVFSSVLFVFLFRKFKEEKRVTKSRKARLGKFKLIKGGFDLDEIFNN